MRLRVSPPMKSLLRQHDQMLPRVSLRTPMFSCSRSYALQHLRQPAFQACPPRLQQLRRPAFRITSPTRHTFHNDVLDSLAVANDAAVAVNGPPDFGFAFDIDGVLLRSSAPLPGASKVLSYLQSNNIPFIFLTNGGGKSEKDRVLELGEKLGVPLSEDNFVQSHTPFKRFVEGLGDGDGLKDKTILVTGGDGDRCRDVAESYGFKNVVTPGDILMAHPEIWPFNTVISDYYESHHRPLPRPVDPVGIVKPLKIDAIFVFNDPRDWALDSQIILDLLFSKQGILGTYSEKNGDTTLPNNGWQQDGQPRLFFSNPDLFWAAAYHLPRIGQGGFQAAFRGLWIATTNSSKLSTTTIGKPFYVTYRYAEEVLNQHRLKMLGGSGDAKNAIKPLEKVFMVGDNPESDIRGANQYESKVGTQWSSILVKTGVFQDGTAPKYAPKFIADDVLDAVKWALKEQGWKGDIE